MKIKVVLGTLFAAGLAAALAVAAPTRADNGTTTTASTPTTTSERHHGKKDDDHERGAKPACERVELKGSNGSGTIALTVSRANRHGSSLVGKQVTLTIPAGATVRANACLDAAGTLTLRELRIDTKKVSTTTTTGTTTTTHA